MKKFISFFLFLLISLTSSSVLAAAVPERFISGSESRGYIDSDNNLWVWGAKQDSDPSQITQYRTRPEKIFSDVKQASFGYSHIIVLKNDGSVWTWGNNTFAQLGNGTHDSVTGTEYTNTPYHVLDNCKEVKAGAYHSAALTNSGELFVWGISDDGEVGNGIIAPWSVQSNEAIIQDGVSNSYIQETPASVLNNVRSMDLGFHMTSAVTNNNELYLWGVNAIENPAEIGNGLDAIAQPKKFMDGVSSVSLNQSGSSGGIIMTNSSLKTFGLNDDGSLGTGNVSYDATIQSPTEIISSGVKSVKMAYGQSVALKTDGSVQVWGNNAQRFVGRSALTPTTLVDSGVKDVATSDFTIGIIKNDNSIWFCGDGYLGNGQSGGSDSFVQVVESVDSPSQPENPGSQTTVPIYRLYNEVSGEHLYTSDKNEYDTLIGLPDWNGEGVGWYAPSSGEAVYRLYNPILADHLYTTDPVEFEVLTTQNGWQADFNSQPLFYSGGNLPIYRLYNTVSHRHLLTKDTNEYNVLPAYDWNQEGAKLYGLSSSSSTPTTPSNPTQPDQPSVPDTPSNPTQPEEPSNPDIPEHVSGEQNVSYRVHLDELGWLDYVQNGNSAGNIGNSYGIQAYIIDEPENPNLQVNYSSYIENIGWQEFVIGGEKSGTTGMDYHIQAVKMHLSGSDASNYDIVYRIKTADGQYSNWAKDDEVVGNTQKLVKIIDLQIRIIPKS